MITDRISASAVFSRVPRSNEAREALMKAFAKYFRHYVLELVEIHREPVFAVYTNFALSESTRLRMRGYIDGWCDAMGV